MKYLNIAIIISICLFFLFGCNTLGVGIQDPGPEQSKKKYHKHGPPPHAPAHGYRHNIMMAMSLNMILKQVLILS